MTTRIVPMSASRGLRGPLPQPLHATETETGPGPQPGLGGLELFDGRVPQHQMLDPVVAAEVDLRLGVVARALHRDHRAKPVGVVGDLVARGQGRNPPVPWRAHAWARS